MIQQDLQAIMDQVSVDRGMPGEPPGQDDRPSATASASTARPGREEAPDEVVEVEVDEDEPTMIEDEETGLVQLQSQAGPPHHMNERALRSDPGEPDQGRREQNPEDTPHDQNAHAHGGPRRRHNLPPCETSWNADGPEERLCTTCSRKPQISYLGIPMMQRLRAWICSVK